MQSGQPRCSDMCSSSESSKLSLPINRTGGTNSFAKLTSSQNMLTTSTLDFSSNYLQSHPPQHPLTIPLLSSTTANSQRLSRMSLVKAVILVPSLELTSNPSLVHFN